MNFKALLAEFLGTFTLIFIGVGAIASNALNGGATGLTGIALAHGLAIAVMVSVTASISGGHFNPAVTLGLLSAKKIDLLNAFGYIVAQCLGAITGAVLIKLCLPATVLASISMGTPALGAGITPSMALVTEIILTFFLVFVIYGVIVDKQSPKLGGLIIGLAIVLDILMGGPISGAAMNPARHLGPALLGGGFQNIWIYWVGPIIGSLLAVQVYQRILENPQTSA